MRPCELLHAIHEETKRRISYTDTRVGCRIELPLLEPSGDSIGVLVRQSSSGYTVHDGGHIGGLLFQSTPDGPSRSDVKTVKAIIQSSGLAEDHDSGIVYVETDFDSIPYWAYEIGRVVSVVASIVPSTLPNPDKAAETAGSKMNVDGL